jgi:hypothetical protein
LIVPKQSTHVSMLQKRSSLYPGCTCEFSYKNGYTRILLLKWMFTRQWKLLSWHNNKRYTNTVQLVICIHIKHTNTVQLVTCIHIKHTNTVQLVICIHIKHTNTVQLVICIHIKHTNTVQLVICIHIKHTNTVQLVICIHIKHIYNGRYVQPFLAWVGVLS